MLNEWPLPNAYKIWTKDEIRIMKLEYKSLGIKEMSKRLGRSEKAVQLKASRLGISEFPAPTVGMRAHKLKHKYNMTVEDYDYLWEQQNGVCAICGQEETMKHQNGKTTRLSVDHNHKTGKVRGLLCRKCNIVIGNAKDNIDILFKAIQYLRK